MINVQSPVDPQSPHKPKPPRIPPLLSTLPPETIESIIAYCEECSSYKEAAQKIRERLSVKISPSSLCKLYTRHRICEDDDTRAELTGAEQANQSAIPDPQSAIASLTEKQLQLRLLELASRANMDHTELRAICQSFARLQSVKLSERRVQLAEAKEARLAESTKPVDPFNPEEYQEGIRVMLGKDPNPEEEVDDDANSDDSTCINAPETNDVVGRRCPSAPRADDTLQNHQPASSAQLPATGQNNPSCPHSLCPPPLPSQPQSPESQSSEPQT
jgi:hypothetical protein